MNLVNWAIKHGVSAAALADLREQMGMRGDQEACIYAAPIDSSEAKVQSQVRVEAPKYGIRLFRNNSGAGKLDNGSFIRWGLCNDSKAMNERIKSADLIGIGKGGQFVAREIKAPGWQYSGTDREKAQLAFLGLIVSMGGDAKFCTGLGSFEK